MSRYLTDWNVDYGDGRPARSVKTPHAWGQDLPVSCEGPVTYRANVEVPEGEWTIKFHGVSYRAEVSIDGSPVADHRGIWDSFEVPVRGGGLARVEVRVTKNGGPAFPVRDVASGFLPYVFHTFGGIYREVELLPQSSGSTNERPVARVVIEGSALSLDGRPFYPRGILHWGWYPEFGHPNPPEEVVRQEVREVKRLGFNLVKFCLWAPPHRYLEILHEEGLTAWMELPLWNPSQDSARQEEITAELTRIVLQYRHHRSIVAWTVGCELGAAAGPRFRQKLTNRVRKLTGSPLVKDDSGGAEMYGGDLREFGTFSDFHPYCDTPFYPVVLDSLLPGPRTPAPILLGEFNDVDVHRNLARLSREEPYWTSPSPELNDQGVRWQYDLPRVLRESRFTRDDSGLAESSRRKAVFMRKTLQEAVRARGDISGYVVTGLRDTPISSSGFFDDWGAPRFREEEVSTWNGDACLFLIPSRHPPWVNGGNRPGWADPLNHFEGTVFLRIGGHGDLSGNLKWRIEDARGAVVAKHSGIGPVIFPRRPAEVDFISWQDAEPGRYRLSAEFGPASNSWEIWVVAKSEPLQARLHDPAGLLSGLECVNGPNAALLATEPVSGQTPSLLFLDREGTAPMPFWREAAYEFNDPDFWERVPFAGEWERLHAVSPDRVLDREWLNKRFGSSLRVLMNRIDTRTYREDPVVAWVSGTLVTTLRPWGGLGVQPSGVANNPAGYELLRSLLLAASSTTA